MWYTGNVYDESLIHYLYWEMWMMRKAPPVQNYQAWVLNQVTVRDYPADKWFSSKTKANLKKLKKK
jgi:hypothetical protein